MKNYLSKIAACIMLAGIFMSVNAQVAQTTPANSGAPQLSEQQLKRAKDLSDRIAGEVTLTDNQKAKLQVSMQEAIASYGAAVRKAKREDDDSKLATVNADLVADVTARIKAILTPEQFNTVMTKEYNGASK